MSEGIAGFVIILVLAIFVAIGTGISLGVSRHITWKNNCAKLGGVVMSYPSGAGACIKGPVQIVQVPM